MGGGGSYYDRDTKDGYESTPRGHSKEAESLMGRDRVDPGVLPMGRRVASRARAPIVLAYDVTGSVDALPMVFADKLPMVAGQIADNGYVDEPEISLAAVGDLGDKAPVQVADFAEIRSLDDWLKRLWREKGGLGNHVEAYAYMAYFYAFCCDIPNAVTPFCVFIADEGMHRTLYKSDLERLFGGTRETISTADVFKELDRRFKGNVFLVHRHYDYGDAEALSVWRECLGDERIVPLGSDRAIADLLLGLFAIVNGVRTLEAYLDDMVNASAKPQSAARIAEVRKSLAHLPAFVASRPAWDDGPGIPTPDDLNQDMDAEQERAIERFLADLRATLKDARRRPKIEEDGWAYVRSLPLPAHAAVATSHGWRRIRDALSEANWRAEIAIDPDADARIVRIRRR